MTNSSEERRQQRPDQQTTAAAAAGQSPLAAAAYFPHVTSPALLAAGHSPDPEPDSRAASMEAGVTILIVENEDSNRTLMEKILGFAGYRYVSASNGVEALEAFDRERPDIVLTDISMPVMDGFEEIASIRARPHGASVPIVAVTAHAMIGDREYALAEGCDEYLVKPYRPRDLLDVVARLLRRSGA
jgi:CheY-like chemotaxis protein